MMDNLLKITKHLNYPNDMCRVCESTGQLTDLTKETSRSMVKKLRAVADISFDVNDELPKGLCKKCNENLDRAYKFKIQCEYTEQKFLDALAECQSVNLPEYVTTTTTANDESDYDLKTEAVDALSQDDEVIYEESSSMISKGEQTEHLIDADIEETSSQTSAGNSQIIGPDVCEDSEANIDYGDVKRLEEEDEQYGDMGEVLEGEIGEYTPIDEQVEYIYDDDAEIEFLDNDTDKSENCLKSETCTKDKSNSRNPQTDKFHCDTCGAPFEKYNDLNEHKKTHGNKRYQCPTCSRWFSKKYHMKNHQTIHLNQKLLACSLCTKKYTNQGNLDRHVRVFHHNEKQYQCEVCQKCFSQSSILRAHLHVHNEERNYECNICHQRYKTIDYLNSHKKRNLPPEQRNFKKYPKKKPSSNSTTVKKCYVCTLCGKKSSSVALHKSHTRTHTGEKPYSCLVCDKSFALRGNLTVHERLHTGETPYHCQHCPKKFYDSNGLKRHNQIHERKKGNSGSTLTQETESNSMMSDIILAEEGVDGGQIELEPKILIDSNGQHYKIEMPPDTESDVGEKIDTGNFYKMNYVDGGATIWVTENN